MKNLDDIMKKITFLKNASDGRDTFNDRLNDIAEVLEVFGIEWQFVENGDFWKAVLK